VTLHSMLKLTEKYIIDNSPTLLSGIAVTGTLMTGYLTGKATFKAADLIVSEEMRAQMYEGQPPHPVETNMDKFKLVWKEYIPPALAVVGTVACIVAANHINAKRMAALAAAYKLSEKQITEYKDKVTEKLGLNKERELRDEINQEAVARTPVSDSMLLMMDNNVIVMEKWTGRYFRSDMETIKSAENKINHDMISNMYATLSDFYDWLNLPHTQESSEVGWSIDNPMELSFTHGMAQDGRTPVLVMEYRKSPLPIRDYHHAGHGAFH
jgi:hypothetical protein